MAGTSGSAAHTYFTELVHTALALFSGQVASGGDRSESKATGGTTVQSTALGAARVLAVRCKQPPLLSLLVLLDAALARLILARRGCLTSILALQIVAPALQYFALQVIAPALHTACVRCPRLHTAHIVPVHVLAPVSFPLATLPVSFLSPSFALVCRTKRRASNLPSHVRGLHECRYDFDVESLVRLAGWDLRCYCCGM